MKVRPYLLPMFLTVLILLSGAVALADRIKYRSELSGDNEVPVRMTGARGEAKVELDKSGSKLRFKLHVNDLKNTWMAHFHMASDGTNGPIVVWLFPRQGPAPATAIAGTTNGKLAEGEITAADLVGPLAGKSLSDLLASINAGTIYVNVHTNDFVDPPNTGPGDFPGGELRGQLHDKHDHDDN